MNETKLLENKLIADHLNNLEHKGLIGIVRPIDSNWWEGMRTDVCREVYTIDLSIYYHVYPIVEPFDLSKWDLTKPECLDIYLNWHNDFLKTLKPKEIPFEDISRRSYGDISIEKFKFNKESYSDDSIKIYFGALNLKEHIGNVLDYGFRILKLDNIHDEFMVTAGKKELILNKLVHFDEPNAGGIVRYSYITLFPNKQYADPTYNANHLKIPLKKENKKI